MSIKTILENPNPDWKAIIDIASARLGKPVDGRFKGSAYHTRKSQPERNTEYHVLHGKKKYV